jgi:cAMP-dependent protein kinase regulator
MEMQQKISEKAKSGARQRSSVCAEVYGNFNKKENFTAKIVPKTNEQKNLIKNRVNQSFMFSALEEKDLKTVVDAMEEKRFQKDDKVIEQGESGDVLYLIETGNLDCFKVFSKGEQQTYLKTYGPGEAFGELALLYNAPRAATIIAKEDCLLWSLDRETFNHIVKDASMKKREKYEKFLKCVEILKSIDAYEINQISDALKTRKVFAGDYIIRKDDIGEEFYILEDGEAYATKPLENCKVIFLNFYLLF